MEERLSVLLCIALLPSFILAIDNILGDKVTFQETEKCKTSRATLVWLKDGSERPVARWDGVWRPEQGYEDRLSPNECVSLNQTNMNDNGLYVLTCGPDSETRTSLHVVPASEALVSEGEPGRLEFHHFTVGKRGEFRMERNGELVLELDLSSGEMRHGTGFEDRLSVSPGWKLSGDLTVTLQDVKPDDQGDFFIYVQDEDETRPREGLSAVRLKIREKIPDQTTRTPPTAAAGICPTQNVTEEKEETWADVILTAAVMFVIVAPSFFLLGWWLKSRCSSSGPCRHQYSDVPPPPPPPPSPPPQANGYSPSNNAQAESMV